MLSQIFKRGWYTEKVTDPIGRFFVWTGVSANFVSFLAVPLAVVAAWFIYQHQLAPGLLFIFLAIATDALDGAIARLRKQVSGWGSYWDAMMDKYAEMIIYVGFALGGWALPALLAAAGTMLISYAKPRAAIVMPLGNEDWPAIGERSDRTILLMAGLLIALFAPIIYGYTTVELTLYLVAVVTNIGAIQRMAFARGLISDWEKSKK